MNPLSDLAKVRTLLQANPKLVFSRDNDGNTPLIMAVKCNHRDVAALLLTNKADVNARGKDESFTGQGFSGMALGDYPLHWVAMFGDKDMVKLLLTNGADLNLKDNGTPLHWAVQSRQK